MSYLKRVLQPDEQVRYVSKIHWIIYLPGLLMTALAIATYIASLMSQAMQPLWLMVGALALIVAVLMLLTAWFRRWTTEIAVTNKRIIYKRGFIRRQTVEMNMDKVASVDVSQSILGRIFNYGSIKVQAAGQNSEALPMIDSPIEFRNHVIVG
jgi:uncharacterized membrane protein YdbT with pleckstrin-like domain